MEEDGGAEDGEISPTTTHTPKHTQTNTHEIAEKSSYEVLQSSRSSIEYIISTMLSTKREALPNSQLTHLTTQMFLHFVLLRQANRSILLEEDRIKAETERAKAPVDFTTLQLHNLMYEKNHYVKAIKTCKDFKSKHPDIELVPEEEFFSAAPPEIKGTMNPNESAHSLMLKRLNFELLQRKELCKLHEKLEQRKKSLLENIANRKKFLSSLPSHLKSLKKASLPVQHQLGVLHTKKLKQHHSAELLPPPLYVIYSQLLAQKEAFGEHIDLDIVGSIKEAQSFARHQANKDSGVSANIESSRMEDDAPDDEDDGQRRRKRPRKAPTKDSLDQAGLLQAHPLKIVLHIHDDEASDPKSAKLITLKFELLLKLNVVCVGIEGSNEGENNILCNLFPNDTGLELPHQSAKLSIGDSFVFDEKRSLRPYKWAQHLAGIDFLPEVSPLLTGGETPSSETAKSSVVLSGLSLYRQQNRVETVVQRIRSRKKAHLALAEQLDSLAKLNWPCLPCENVPWASHTPICNLHYWSPLGLSPDQVTSTSIVDTDQVENHLDIVMDDRPITLKEDIENAREDGELPALVPVPAVAPAAVVDDVKPLHSRGSDLEHSRQLALITKSVTPPISKVKSSSFRKREEETDLLDIGSDLDEPVQLDLEIENEGCEVAENTWVDCAHREFSLVLARKMDANDRNVKLEAKIKISVEYPLRPPLFTLSAEDHSESGGAEWFNELRAMEAEVNLHIIKMVSWDEENCMLAHQVRCLAMLFDFYMDEASPSSEKRTSTSVVDIGLSKPVSGKILARSFRGRDRRKMISWRDTQCTPGYPY